MHLSKRSLGLLATTLLAFGAVPAAALPADPASPAAESPKAGLAFDRAAILAMAGDYRVTFDMQESTPWIEGYEPLERRISGGYESVRVIEDSGERIVLQHLLVVGSPDNPVVVKHWRQDWEYEPEHILAYAGNGHWELEDVPADERSGRWSQTVYQVDDSPRYAGWGQWEEMNGVVRWRSSWTMRPLARRDATRSPIYDHYVGINRHQLTPTGWIHWQDNTKMMPAADGNGGMTPVVQEYVLNTYERFDDYNVAAADAYWQASQAYWAAVRAEWQAVIDANGAVVIAEEAETGTVISGELLDLGTRLARGEIAEAEAIARAQTLIREGTAAAAGAGTVTSG